MAWLLSVKLRLLGISTAGPHPPPAWASHLLAAGSCQLATGRFPGDPTVLGNAALDDLIHLCQGLGIETGIDLVKYMGVCDRMTQLTGRPSASFVSREVNPEMTE
jgi:hypothetical protein